MFFLRRINSCVSGISGAAAIVSLAPQTEQHLINQSIINRLNSLKVTELQRIASSSGLACSSKTKSDLVTSVSAAMALANTAKQQILSIDLGFKNFSYALFRPLQTESIQATDLKYDLVQWSKVGISLDRKYNPLIWTNQVKSFIDNILTLSQTKTFSTTILIERQSTRGAFFSRMPITILSLLRLEATLHALLKDEDVRLMDPSMVYSSLYKKQPLSPSSSSSVVLLTAKATKTAGKSAKAMKALKRAKSKEKKELATKYTLDIITRKPFEDGLTLETPERTHDNHIVVNQQHVNNFMKTTKKDDLADSFLQGKAHIDWTINLRKEYQQLLSC